MSGGGGANFSIETNPTRIEGPIYWLQILSWSTGATWQIERGPTWTITGLHSAICKRGTIVGRGEEWFPFREAVFSGTVTVRVGRAPNYPGPEARAHLVDTSGRTIVVGVGANNEVRTTPYASTAVFSVDPASGTLGAAGTTRIELGTQPTSYQRLAARLKCVTGAISTIQLVRSFDAGATWVLAIAGAALAAGDSGSFDVGPGIGATPLVVCGLSWGIELTAGGAGATYTYASAGST